MVLFVTPKARRRRKGGAAVELAVVLPFFLLFVFGLVEYGRARMINNLLKASTRMAARTGANENVTSDEAEAVLRNMMRSSLNTDRINVAIKDASVYDDPNGDYPVTAAEYNNLPDVELANTPSRQLFLVRATVSYSDVSLLPLPFWEGIVLEGQAVMRHE